MTETYMKEYLDNNGEIILNTSADKIEKMKIVKTYILSQMMKKGYLSAKICLCCGSIDTVFLMKRAIL